MAKLLSHHDPDHIHAMCGVLTLIHIFYRFRLIILDVKDAGFGIKLDEDLLSMIIMNLPQVTSFVFSFVPTKKGVDGFIIWKEYRWHAFIFTTQLWLLTAMLLFQRHMLPEGLKYEKIYRITIVLGTKFFARMATNHYPPQESTIRGMYTNSLARFVATYAQFLGAAMLMIGLPGDDLGLLFYGISIIQLNAFNMTMRKKKKIGPAMTQVYYSLMISSGYYLFLGRRWYADFPSGIFDPRVKMFHMATIAYIMRCKLRSDRFTTWIVAISCIELMEQKFGLF